MKKIVVMLSMLVLAIYGCDSGKTGGGGGNAGGGGNGGGGDIPDIPLPEGAISAVEAFKNGLTTYWVNGGGNDFGKDEFSAAGIKMYDNGSRFQGEYTATNHPDGSVTFKQGDMIAVTFVNVKTIDLSSQSLTTNPGYTPAKTVTFTAGAAKYEMVTQDLAPDFTNVESTMLAGCDGFMGSGLDCIDGSKNGTKMVTVVTDESVTVKDPNNFNSMGGGYGDLLKVVMNKTAETYTVEMLSDSRKYDSPLSPEIIFPSGKYTKTVKTVPGGSYDLYEFRDANNVLVFQVYGYNSPEDGDGILGSFKRALKQTQVYFNEAAEANLKTGLLQ